MAGLQPGRRCHLGGDRAADRGVSAAAELRQLQLNGTSGRLDRVLGELEPELTRSAAARLIKAGLVRLNGRLARPSEMALDGDLLEYELPPRRTEELQSEPISLDIVYQDEELVVINKPAGMVVHPGAGQSEGTLVHALLGLGGEWSKVGGSDRPGIVHRLDKGTSGLILAARNDLAHRQLAEQLRSRSLSRIYLVVVRGRVKADQGVLEGPIGRHPGGGLRRAVVEGGRPARTNFLTLARATAHTLLQCQLESGRTHQIRVHLTSLGYPVVGDELYGQIKPGDPPRPLLHAWKLRLRHPRDDRELSFMAEPPLDFRISWRGFSGSSVEPWRGEG
ncbi:MAG: RluA family pseudouridine synthase [Candidatus Dormibacteraceae bacterium]